MRRLVFVVVLALACVACGPGQDGMQVPPPTAKTQTETHSAASAAADEGYKTKAVPSSSHAPQPPLKPSATPVTAVPTEVAAIIERASECGHFAGEFNGDRSERDTEIDRTMTELACDTVKRDVEAMHTRYPHLAALQPTIDDVDGF